MLLSCQFSPPVPVSIFRIRITTIRIRTRMPAFTYALFRSVNPADMAKNNSIAINRWYPTRENDLSKSKGNETN
jgi:hypothetical protein